MLTSGRRCSRSRLEDGRWHGEGVRGDVGVLGGVDVPAPVRLPLPTRTASSPSREWRLKSSSLACRRRPGASAPSLGSTQRRRVCSLSLTADSSVGRKTPKGSVVGALRLRPRPAFESRGRGRQGESPKLPWLDQPGDRGGAGFPRASQVAGARCEGAKAEYPPRARLDPCARAHRPLGVRARQAGRALRTRGCGAGRLVRRIRGEEGKG
jgi:hypothetical protein